MSPRGKEHYQTLRIHFRAADWRRFRVRNRHNRYAEIIGFGPNGTHMMGWWEGTDDLREFDPDDAEWTERTTYV